LSSNVLVYELKSFWFDNLILPLFSACSCLGGSLIATGGGRSFGDLVLFVMSPLFCFTHLAGLNRLAKLLLIHSQELFRALLEFSIVGVVSELFHSLLVPLRVNLGHLSGTNYAGNGND
jgi:hypothetical protein